MKKEIKHALQEWLSGPDELSDISKYMSEFAEDYASQLKDDFVLEGSVLEDYNTWLEISAVLIDVSKKIHKLSLQLSEV